MRITIDRSQYRFLNLNSAKLLLFAAVNFLAGLAFAELPDPDLSGCEREFRVLVDYLGVGKAMCHEDHKVGDFQQCADQFIKRKTEVIRRLNALEGYLKTGTACAYKENNAINNEKNAANNKLLSQRIEKLKSSLNSLPTANSVVVYFQNTCFYYLGELAELKTQPCDSASEPKYDRHNLDNYRSWRDTNQSNDKKEFGLPPQGDSGQTVAP